MSYKRLIINGTEYVLASDIFMATYGVTTNAEMWKAVQDGQLLRCYDAGTNSIFQAFNVTETKAQFSGYAANSGDLITWVCENNAWSAGGVKPSGGVADLVIEINNEASKNPEDLKKSNIVFDPVEVRNVMTMMQNSEFADIRIKGEFYINTDGPWKMNSKATFAYGNQYWLSVFFELYGPSGVVTAQVNFTYNSGTPIVYGLFVAGNEITE